MKAFTKFSSVVLFVLLLPLISQAADPSPIKYGINVSYIHSFCDVNNRNLMWLLQYPDQSGMSVFQDESMNGFGIGANINYNLFDGETLSHSLGLRSNFEMYNNERIKNLYPIRYSYVSENGDTTDILSYSKEHASLKLSYVNVDIIYCFNFFDKHIGIEIGPSLSFLVSNELSTKFQWTDPITRIKEVKQIIVNKEIDDVKKFNITFNVGLNFPIQCGNFEVVPFVSYKPRTVYDKNSGNAPLVFKTNNLSAGLIVRY